MKWSFLLPLLSWDVSTICLDQHGVDFPGVLGLRRTCPLSGCPTPGRERFVWKDKDSLGRDLGALSSTSVRRRTIPVETWNDVALAQTIINLEKETIRLFWDQQKICSSVGKVISLRGEHLINCELGLMIIFLLEVKRNKHRKFFLGLWSSSAAMCHLMRERQEVVRSRG